MRLDKVIEQQLNTSRKEMKRLFQQGKVLVDQRIEGRPERNVDSAIHQIIVRVGSWRRRNAIISSTSPMVLLQRMLINSIRQ